MRKLSFAIAVSLLGAALSPAFAADEVSLRVSTDFAADSGLYASGGAARLVQGELGYAHALKTFRGGQLWIEGSWTIGGRHDRIFSAFDTSLLAQSFTAGLRITLPIRHWLVPQLRAGVGALLGTLQLNGIDSGNLDQTAAAFTGYALGGVQFLLPRPWMARGGRGVTAGLVVEAGYSYATDLRYTISPSAMPNTVQMPTTPTDLGALSLSGALLRVGLLLRF